MAIKVDVDETNVKNVITALQNMLNDVDKISDSVLKEIVSKGEMFLDLQYASRPKDPNITDISTSWKKISNGYALESKGKDVVYEEFGTGDEGASHPHPAKSNYNLNDYNSGEYIRNVSDYDENSYVYDDLQAMGIKSGKFWRYYKNDTLYYTQGVPSGQEMWKTRNELIKSIIPDIGKKKGRELCEKFANSIKK